MKKVLLSMSICFLTIVTFGQNPSWNLAPGSSNYNFIYNFAATTGTGGAGAFFPNPTTLTSQTSSSKASSPGFLPYPMSGTALLRTGSSGLPFFTLQTDGSSNPVDAMKINVSSTGTVGKFAIYDTDGSTALTSVFFNLNFDELTAKNEDWVVAIGKSTGSSSFFNTSSGVSTTSNTSNPEIFGVLKFTVSATSGKMDVAYRIKAAAGDTPTAPVLTTINRGTDYKFEVLCNNTATVQTYKRVGLNYTVPSRKYHVWAGGTRLEVAAADYDFPANELPVNSNINSFLLAGSNGKDANNTDATIGSAIISKFSMQFANSTLPVSLTKFTAKAEFGKVNLNWQTASESDNSHFDILRFSNSNTTPAKIGEVKGSGNSNTLTSYNFKDATPLAGANYYQLSQVDFNGKSTPSQIVPVSVGLQTSDFTVYQDDFNAVNANVNSPVNTTASFLLINAQGNVINHVDAQLQRGNNSVQISAKALKAGVYVAQLTINGAQTVKKIIVN